VAANVWLVACLQAHYGPIAALRVRVLGEGHTRHEVGALAVGHDGETCEKTDVSMALMAKVVKINMN